MREFEREALYDLFAHLLSNGPFTPREHITRIGDFNHTCKEAFTEFAEQLPRARPQKP